MAQHKHRTTPNPTDLLATIESPRAPTEERIRAAVTLGSGLDSGTLAPPRAAPFLTSSRDVVALWRGICSTDPRAQGT